MAAIPQALAGLQESTKALAERSRPPLLDLKGKGKQKDKGSTSSLTPVPESSSTSAVEPESEPKYTVDEVAQWLNGIDDDSKWYGDWDHESWSESPWLEGPWQVDGKLYGFEVMEKDVAGAPPPS